MSEQIRNNASTTLSGSIDSTQTTLTVASGTGFPSSGNFRIKIEGELLLVTGVSGTTWTVTRGIESTSGAGHANAVAIIHVLTEKGLEVYVGEYIRTGASGSLPAAEKAGRLYLPNDGVTLLRDTGSAWENFGPIWPLTTPLDSGYSWGNQQSATYTARNDGILINGGTAGASAWTVRGRRKNRAGTATGYKITVGMMSMLGNANFAMAGCGLYESGSDKCEFIRCHSDSGSPRVSVTRTTALQAGSTTDLGTSIEIGYLGSFPLIHWMQIEQTSTNLVFRYSTNGVDWFQLDSHSITASFSAAPDQFILHVIPYSNVANALFVSVKEET